MVNNTTMRYQTKLQNNYKSISSSTSVLGIITNVNESKYTVDVFLPQSNANIYDVTIGTSILGSGASFKMLPGKNQKCIVILSAMHFPVVIAIIPNQKQETKNLLLSNEIKMGLPDAFFKLSKDKSIELKTSKSILRCGESIDMSAMKKSFMSPFIKSVEDGINGYGVERRNFFMGKMTKSPVPKGDFVKNGIIDQELKSTIMEDNEKSLSKMYDMINEFEGFAETHDMLSDSIIDDLNNLRAELDIKYGDDIKNYLSVEFGAVGDSILKMEYEREDGNKTFIKFGRDGKIYMDCKDLIITKQEV